MCPCAGPETALAQPGLKQLGAPELMMPMRPCWELERLDFVGGKHAVTGNAAFECWPRRGGESGSWGGWGRASHQQRVPGDYWGWRENASRPLNLGRRLDRHCRISGTPSLNCNQNAFSRLRSWVAACTRKCFKLLEFRQLIGRGECQPQAAEC